MKKDTFDELIVVKRSGQRVNFNSYKIAIVIKKAYDNVYQEYNESEVNKIYENVLNYLEVNYSDRKTINVEDIQDIIEVEMKKVSEDVYKAFSEYRQKRAESRKAFKIKQQHKFAKAMEKIADGDILSVDNNYSPTEIILRCGNTVVNEYAKAYVIDNKYLRAHEEGKIYIHDIDSVALGKFAHIHIDISHDLQKDDSIEALGYRLLSIKTEVKGEVNLSAIDYSLEPWILKKFREYFTEYLNNYLTLNGFNEYINFKKLEEKIQKLVNIEDSIEELEQFINSNIVRNIFTSAKEDALRKVESKLKKELERLFDKLNSTNDKRGYSVSFASSKNFFGKMVNELILDYIKEKELMSLHFIAKIYDLENPFLKRIEELIVDGKSILVSMEKGRDAEVEYFFNGMRLYDNNNEEEASSVGRLIVGETSINMARLALENKESSKGVLYKNFEEVLEFVKNGLLSMFETIGNKNKDNYNILFQGNIVGDERLQPGQKIRKVIKNSSLAINLVGLKECVMLLKKDSIEQYELLIDLLKLANKKANEFSINTKLNFIITEEYDDEASREFVAFDKAIYGIKKGLIDANKYDLVSNLDVLKCDLGKLSKVELFLNGGNTIEYLIQKNASVSKIHKAIENYLKSGVRLVYFTKEDWYKR